MSIFCINDEFTKAIIRSYNFAWLQHTLDMRLQFIIQRAQSAVKQSNDSLNSLINFSLVNLSGILLKTSSLYSTTVLDLRMILNPQYLKILKPIEHFLHSGWIFSSSLKCFSLYSPTLFRWTRCSINLITKICRLSLTTWARINKDWEQKKRTRVCNVAFLVFCLLN